MRTISVTVKDKRDDKVIPYAEVHFWILKSGEHKEVQEWRDLAPSPIDKKLEPLSEVYTADAQGMDSIPHPNVPYALAGRTGDLYSPPTSPTLGMDSTTLRLSQAGPIEIQVVDRQGNPMAGVDVGLDAGSYSGVEEQVRTNAEGRAKFELRALSRGELTVGLVGLYDRNDYRPIDLTNPEEPMQLVAPEMGSLEIELYGTDGLLMSQGMQLTVTCPNLDATSWSPRSNNYGIGHEIGRLRTYASRGKAVFPRIPVGLELKIEARSPDGEYYAVRTLEGPTQAGEMMPVGLSVSSPIPILTCRILNTRGMVGKGVMLNAAVRDASWSLHGTVSNADRNGVFRMALDELPDPEKDYYLSIELILPTSNPPRFVVVPLPELHEAKLYDLGDLVMRPVEVLAEGRVTDHQGRPVKNAVVAIGSFRADEVPLFWDARFSSLFSTKTDEHGDYTLMGVLAPTSNSIHVRHDNHLDSGRDLPLTDSKWNPVLDGKHDYTGRFTAPEGIDLAGLAVYFIDSDDQFLGSSKTDKRGRFTVPPDCISTRTLRLYDEAHTRILFETALPETTPTLDAPFLGRFDLVGLRRVHLTFSGWPDPSLRPVHLWIDGSRFSQTTSKRDFSFLTMRPTSSIQAQRKGGPMVRQMGIIDGMDLEVPEGILLTLVPELPEDLPRTLSVDGIVSTVPSREGEEVETWYWRDIHQEGKPVYVPRPGEYEVELHFRYRAPRRSDGPPLLVPMPPPPPPEEEEDPGRVEHQRITVTAEEQPPTFYLTITQDMMEVIEGLLP